MKCSGSRQQMQQLKRTDSPQQTVCRSNLRHQSCLQRCVKARRFPRRFISQGCVFTAIHVSEIRFRTASCQQSVSHSNLYQQDAFFSESNS
jgi:hypothetical protein